MDNRVTTRPGPAVSVPTEAAKTRRGAWLAAAVILLLGTALRLQAARNDLWLDEIWTLDLVATVTHPLDIVSLVNHANNHYLNSLYQYLLGEEASAISRRLLAIASGSATIALAGLLGRRHGAAEALCAMLLVALSYPLIHYGSEARGYAPMLLSVLLAYYWLEAFLIEARWGHCVFFTGAVALGLLSHLTMTLACLGLGLWASLVVFRRAESARRALGELFMFFSPAATISIVFAVKFLLDPFDFGEAATGIDASASGGNHGVFAYQGLGTLLQYLLGLPQGLSPGTALTAGLAATAVLLASLLRGGEERGWLYAIMLLVVPLGVLLSGTPSGEAPRFFLIFGLFFLLLLAQALARAARRGRAGRWLSALVLALFALANARQLQLFAEAGRGNYAAAVAYIAAHSEAETITLASDRMDLQNRIVLAYYGPIAARGKTLNYVPVERRIEARPDWLLKVAGVHYGEAPPPGTLTLRGPDHATGYVLKAQFRSWGLSGWTWAVYRRQDE